MRREYIQSISGFVLLVAFSLAFGHPAAVREGDGKHSIRLAYFPNLTHAPVLVAVKDHLYDRRLPGYSIQPFVVNAGPEAMEALLAGEIDMACVGPSPALNAYLKSHGKALRIVSGVCSGGASLMARPGAGVGSVADLAGKRVAAPELGGTQDVSLRHFMKLSGLSSREQGGTVDVMSIKNPDILTAMRRGQIDAAWVPEPWASRLAAEAGARRVVDERSLWPSGTFTTAVLVARTGFISKDPQAVASIVQGTLDAVREINADRSFGQREANAALEILTGKPLKKKVIADAWDRLKFSTELDRRSLSGFVSAARDAGYLKSDRLDLDLVCYSPSATAREIAAR